MKQVWKIRAGILAAAISVLPMSIYAHDQAPGPGPGYSGAPGDSTCAECHGTGRVNSTPGSVSIAFPNGMTYTPGVVQRLIVTVTDAAAKRWGFEASPRDTSAPDKAGGGALTPADGSTQTYTDGNLQWICHTFSGAAANTYAFDWTPPGGVAEVTFYIAGNGANGNGREDVGDHIYTASYTLKAAGTALKPVISDNGVANGATFKPGIAQNSWITITGKNLAGNTRGWGTSDLPDGKLPASLDGVTVTVNGKPAFVEFISPTQINAVAPSDSATGAVPVVVTAYGQPSDPVMATLQNVSPAFFTFSPGTAENGKYLAATHTNYSFLGKPGLFPGAAGATTPATPGESVILYGTGFGSTNPAIPSGQLTDKLAPLVTLPVITIGGVKAQIDFGGLVAPFAAMYQFNVKVPPNVGSGDAPVVATVNGVNSPTAFLTVK